MFDLSELKLISEFHTDVLATPVDQIIPAFDYVKGKVLGGKPYRRDDQTKVALELKKFLTSSMEEKQRALHEAAHHQKGLAEAERAKRVRAEADVEAKEGEVECLRREMEAGKKERLSREKRAAENEREKLEQLEAEVQRAGRRGERKARAVRRLCGGVAVLGSAVAGGIWAMDVAIARVFWNGWNGMGVARAQWPSALGSPGGYCWSDPFFRALVCLERVIVCRPLRRWRRWPLVVWILSVQK